MATTAPTPALTLAERRAAYAFVEAREPVVVASVEHAHRNA